MIFLFLKELYDLLDLQDIKITGHPPFSMESPNGVSNPEVVIDNGKRTRCVKQLFLCLDMVDWFFSPLEAFCIFQN